MSHEEIVRQNRRYTLVSWQAQGGWNPLSMVRGDGVYFWDGDDKRYIDWSSQLINVNVGNNHPRVIEAIQKQAAE